MATMKFNPLVDQARGRYGHIVLRQMRGKTILAYPPKEQTGPAAPAQVHRRELFREAAAYSKGVFRNPVRVAPYAAAPEAQERGVFATIMTDFLKSPVIRSMSTAGYHGHVGNTVVLRTRMDLPPLTVTVSLRSEDSVDIESGEALLTAGEWRYVATQAVPAGTPLTLEVTVADADSIEVKRSVPLVVA
jgi:hypothetical protein